MSCSVHPEKWISINFFSVSFPFSLSLAIQTSFDLLSSLQCFCPIKQLHVFENPVPLECSALYLSNQIKLFEAQKYGHNSTRYSVTSVLLHFLDFSRLTQCFLHCIGHFIFKLYINSKLYALFFRKKRRKNQGLRSNSARQGYNHIRDKSVSLVIRLFVTNFSPVVSVGDAT